MEQSQSKAYELQKAQSMQVQVLAAQSEVQKEIQRNAQVSQALLDKATTTAANLHAIIDEAAAKYKRIPDLRFGGFSTWTLCGALLILIGSHNMKAAVSLFFLVFGTRHSAASKPPLTDYRTSNGGITNAFPLVISLKLAFKLLDCTIYSQCIFTL
jgi:hypothetical protein